MEVAVCELRKVGRNGGHHAKSTRGVAPQQPLRARASPHASTATVRTPPSTANMIDLDSRAQRQPAGTPLTKRRSDPTSGNMHTRIFTLARTAHALRTHDASRSAGHSSLRAKSIDPARLNKLKHAHAHIRTYTHAPAYTKTQTCRERERERARASERASEREMHARTHTHTRDTTQAPIPEPIGSTNQPKTLVTVGASCCSESRPFAAHPPHTHARAKDAGMCVSI